MKEGHRMNVLVGFLVLFGLIAMSGLLVRARVRDNSSAVDVPKSPTTAILRGSSTDLELAESGLARGDNEGSLSTPGHDDNPNAIDIEITDPPEVVTVGPGKFLFEYSTNNACGRSSFVVQKKSTGELVNSFTGESGCAGPRHSGFPQADGNFGGFTLEPLTTYIVTVTVTGTLVEGPQHNESLVAGTGMDSATFEVTTTAE